MLCILKESLLISVSTLDLLGVNRFYLERDDLRGTVLIFYSTQLLRIRCWASLTENDRDPIGHPLSDIRRLRQEQTCIDKVATPPRRLEPRYIAATEGKELWQSGRVPEPNPHLCLCHFGTRIRLHCVSFWRGKCCWWHIQFLDYCVGFHFFQLGVMCELHFAASIHASEIHQIKVAPIAKILGCRLYSVTGL